MGLSPLQAPRAPWCPPAHPKLSHIPVWAPAGPLPGTWESLPPLIPRPLQGRLKMAPQVSGHQNIPTLNPHPHPQAATGLQQLVGHLPDTLLPCRFSRSRAEEGIPTKLTEPCTTCVSAPSILAPALVAEAQRGESSRPRPTAAKSTGRI